MEHPHLPMLLIGDLKLGKDICGEHEDRNEDEGEPRIVDSQHLHDVTLSVPSTEAGDDVVWLAWVLEEEHHLQLPWSHRRMAPHDSGAANKTTPDAICVNGHSGDDSNRVNVLIDTARPIDWEWRGHPDAGVKEKSHGASKW